MTAFTIIGCIVYGAAIENLFAVAWAFVMLTAAVLVISRAVLLRRSGAVRRVIFRVRLGPPSHPGCLWSYATTRHPNRQTGSPACGTLKAHTDTMRAPDTGPAPPIAAFWDAVARSSTTLFTDMLAAFPKTTSEFDQLRALLDTAEPGLVITIGEQDGPRLEFVVSADGNKKLFPAVLTVVDAAPTEVTTRFDVHAFRPRISDPAGLQLTIKGRTVTPADILWSATQHRRSPSVCDLHLHIPGWIDALPLRSLANEATAAAVFALLDHVLGEYTVEMQIGVIDWASPGKAPADTGNLLSLPGYLDDLCASPR